MTCSPAVRIGIAMRRHAGDFGINAKASRPRRMIRYARADARRAIKETSGE